MIPKTNKTISGIGRAGTLRLHPVLSKQRLPRSADELPRSADELPRRRCRQRPHQSRLRKPLRLLIRRFVCYC